jgi:hypothetical protein
MRGCRTASSNAAKVAVPAQTAKKRDITPTMIVVVIINISHYTRKTFTKLIDEMIPASVLA